MLSVNSFTALEVFNCSAGTGNCFSSKRKRVTFQIQKNISTHSWLIPHPAAHRPGLSVSVHHVRPVYLLSTDWHVHFLCQVCLAGELPGRSYVNLSEEKSRVFWKTSAATLCPDRPPKLNLGVGNSSKSENPSLNSFSNSSLVQLHEVIRKKPFTFSTLERDLTYCFLFSTALSGFRLMASKVPLSIQI